ncbi:MAG: hypothetical protein KDK40_02290 [Chlamydiia bacterium]|nr:hypothetical protein [Chlamydiia bacterium]
MRSLKSERLKKLETELTDLEQWLKLGLVPKKDIAKHKDEIENIRSKIDEETQRLKFLKETGEAEDFTPQKRSNVRGSYTEMPTLPDLEIGDGETNTDGRFDNEGEADEMESEHSDLSERSHHDETKHGSEKKSEDEEFEDDVDEESYFSEKNRWRRGGIVDPDANEW